MDGQQFRLIMNRFLVLSIMSLFSLVQVSSEEILDEAFLLFIAETADIEELGVDIGQLLDGHENQDDDDSEEEAK